MSHTYMQNFHTKFSTVDNVSPGVNYTALAINYRLIKLKPFRLKAIVLIPKAVNQIPITGQAAKKMAPKKEKTITTTTEKNRNLVYIYIYIYV
jgi:hypothetical protein